MKAAESAHLARLCAPSLGSMIFVGDSIFFMQNQTSWFSCSVLRYKLSIDPASDPERDERDSQIIQNWELCAEFTTGETKILVQLHKTHRNWCFILINLFLSLFRGNILKQKTFSDANEPSTLFPWRGSAGSRYSQSQLWSLKTTRSGHAESHRLMQTQAQVFTVSWRNLIRVTRPWC